MTTYIKIQKKGLFHSDISTIFNAKRENDLFLTASTVKM